MKHPLYFNWGVSMLFGWGVYGLNLLRHWPQVSGTSALCIGKIQVESLSGMDPLALRALAQPLVDSDQIRLQIAAIEPGIVARLNGIVLHSMGNHFSGSLPPSQGGVTGLVTGAAIFFEDTNLAADIGVTPEYALIITGSTWCEQVLRGHGVDNVATVVQGIDPSLFHPAPRAGWLEGRFAVFSGGKIEHRKAQDLVLLAFRAFAERHPEAVLITAWNSPWPIAAVTINTNSAIAPVGLTAEGQVDLKGWVAANGLPEDQFIDLGAIPNHLMAKVVREMDVALFPNRCEGGTNLVAMECMACGVPVILSDNTGHKDLLATGGGYGLTRQGPVSVEGRGTDGWGESDIEEIVESLETVWANRESARAMGERGAAAMAQWSWRNQISRLHEVLTPYCP